MPKLSEEILKAIRPGARAFLGAGLSSLEHAYSHASGSDPQDAAQVLMSAAHGAEMICKAALVQKEKSLFRGGRGRETISLRETLQELGTREHSAEMQILAGRRDPVYHFASYTDMPQALDNLEVVRGYVSDLLRDDFGLELELVAELPAFAEAVPRQGAPIEETAATQRDAAFGGALLAWAQGEEGTDRLRIRLLESNGARRWLSPSEEFEYMPHTDGRSLVAYRQSGGVIHYDLVSNVRTVLSETGGPGAVQGGIIAAQGIGVSDGLGGGVWLLSSEGDSEQVSESGDSPRLDLGYVIWQELWGEEMTVRRRGIQSGPMEVLAINAWHFAIHGGLFAFQERGRSPRLFALELDQGHGPTQVSKNAIFPDVRNGRIAYLEGLGDRFDLHVLDWLTRRVLLSLENVPFPTGRGPILTDTHVIWEGREFGRSGHLLSSPLE